MRATVASTTHQGDDARGRYADEREENDTRKRFLIAGNHRRPERQAANTYSLVFTSVTGTHAIHMPK